MEALYDGRSLQQTTSQQPRIPVIPLVCSDNEANIFRYSLVMSCLLSKKYINVTYSDTQVNAENIRLILQYPRLEINAKMPLYSLGPNLSIGSVSYRAASLINMIRVPRGFISFLFWRSISYCLPMVWC